MLLWRSGRVEHLYWCQQFVLGWNGVSFWLFKGLGPIRDVEVTSDAAGSIGFGAYWVNHIIASNKFTFFANDEADSTSAIAKAILLSTLVL